jgi:hypothetical protein
MNPRWWRIGVLFEEQGAPWTWTFHVRAFSEESARRLVAERLGDRAFTVHVCHPSEPLPRAPREEEIAADYGPFRRSWDDPAVKQLTADS